MKTKLHILVAIGLVLSAVFAAVPQVRTLANPDTTIDTFEIAQAEVATNAGSLDASVTDAGGSIIGGQRDVIATHTSGANFVRILINGGVYGHSVDNSTFGTTEVQWDGDDGGATTIDPNGLPDVDFTVGGDNAFILELVSADLGADITLTVWDYTANNPNTCLQLTKSFPAQGSSELKRVVVFRFAEFAVGGTCTNGGTTLQHVGAVRMFVNTTLNASTDVTLDMFKTGKLDYGDLPNVFLATRLINDGAGHVISPLYMGSLVDGSTTENAGTLGNLGATGDDINTSDDEDGVVPVGLWNMTDGGAVDVTVAGGDGCLSAWFDWDGGAMINVFDNQPVTTGVNHVTFPVLVDMAGNTIYARFRLYPRDAGNVCTSAKYLTRQATGGEVEDYVWNFGPTAVQLSSASATPGPQSLAGVGLLALACVAAGTLLVVRRRRA